MTLFDDIMSEFGEKVGFLFRRLKVFSSLVWLFFFVVLLGLMAHQLLQVTRCYTWLIHELNLRFSTEDIVDNIPNKPELNCPPQQMTNLSNEYPEYNTKVRLIILLHSWSFRKFRAQLYPRFSQVPCDLEGQYLLGSHL